MLYVLTFIYRKQKLKEINILNNETINNNDTRENINADIHENTMQVDKDGILQDVVHDKLAAMGIETNNYEENATCISSNKELEEILEDDIENEEMDTLGIDSNIDAFRVNSGSMPGKCIVDFVFLFQQLHEKFDNHSRGIECLFRDLIFIGARAYGLKNKLFFKCRMCNFEEFVWSEPSSEENLDVNIGAVAGALLTDVGFTQLQESCAATMNIKCMGRKTYEKAHETAAEAFAKAADESMNAAANEERELALQHNEVINGIPHIYSGNR